MFLMCFFEPILGVDFESIFEELGTWASSISCISFFGAVHLVRMTLDIALQILTLCFTVSHLWKETQRGAHRKQAG